MSYRAVPSLEGLTGRIVIVPGALSEDCLPHWIELSSKIQSGPKGEWLILYYTTLWDWNLIRSPGFCTTPDFSKTATRQSLEAKYLSVLDSLKPPKSLELGEPSLGLVTNPCPKIPTPIENKWLPRHTVEKQPRVLCHLDTQEVVVVNQPSQLRARS